MYPYKTQKAALIRYFIGGKVTIKIQMSYDLLFYIGQ